MTSYDTHTHRRIGGIIVSKDDLVAMYDNAKTDEEVAKHFDVSRQYIQTVRKQFNIPSNKFRISNTIKSLYKQGYLSRDIAQELKLSYRVIYGRLKTLRLKSHTINNANGCFINGKLITKQELVDLINRLGTDEAVAKNIGITRSHVYSLRYRWHIISARQHGINHIKELYDRGVSIEEIAKQTNRDVLTVRFYLKKRFNITLDGDGLTQSHPPKQTPVQDAFLKLFNENKTAKEIQTIMKYKSIQHVYGIAYRCGVTFRERNNTPS